MILSDLIRTAVRQIFRNWRRYRSALVGTTLGTASLITVLTVGDSVEGNLGKNLDILGSATIVKVQWSHRESQIWHRGQYRQKDLDDLRKLPGVHAVSPAVFLMGQSMTYQSLKKPGVRLAGIEPSIFQAVHLPIAEGRGINEKDLQKGRSVCVIGKAIKDALFSEGDNPLGKQVYIQGIPFRVVGVIGQAEDPAFKESALLPISVARSKIPGMYEIGNIYVRPVNWDIVPNVQAMVEALLKGNHPGYAGAMQVISYHDRLESIKKIVFTFKFFLYAAIVVTLVLGGLGITNVMLALVKERTTEIGLRKAVGATQTAILIQFLCESLLVNLAGAVVGIVCGSVGVYFLQQAIEIDAAWAVFLVSVAASIGIGLLLGVLSGVVPASSAAKLDPVVAMKFE